MDKILHTPKVLFDIRRLDGQTTTIMTPIEHPRVQCCALASRGGLTCARFCPLNRGVTQGCVVSTNIKQEWVSGELHTLRSDVAPNKPVQDYVHQLSCGRRSKGCPNPASLVLVGFELALTHHI